MQLTIVIFTVVIIAVIVMVLRMVLLTRLVFYNAREVELLFRNTGKTLDMIEKLQQKIKDMETESNPHPPSHLVKQEIDISTDKTEIESSTIEKTETETDDTSNDKVAANTAVIDAANATGVPDRAGQTEAETINDSFGEDMRLVVAIRNNMELKRKIHELKSLQLEHQNNYWTSTFRSAHNGIPAEEIRCVFDDN